MKANPVRGHALVIRHGVRGVFAILAAMALLTALAVSAYAAPPRYRFTKAADSTRDGFDPFRFECSSINNRGDIAFRAGRPAPNSTDGIYRVNAADGSLTTIVEDAARFNFIGRNPSMNDSGAVSFAANLRTGEEAIFRGSGERLVEIASTEKEFNFFGFDTSVNNDGDVAFKAERDAEFNFDEGLFSGDGKLTTHYLNSTTVSLDGQPVRFDGNDSRPSINNLGDIAFDESINFDDGIFVGREGTFRTIAAPDPNRSVQEPVLNDAGTAAFETSFFDEASQQFVTAIVTGSGGPLTTVADTRGDFGSFGFRPPSLNNHGDVAFHATLDGFETSGIFAGPDPRTDRVIATGDRLDGSTVQNLTFCEEGLNDSDQLAFTAQLADRTSPVGFRMAVFRATPR
jgi:hypothetical protein